MSRFFGGDFSSSDSESDVSEDEKLIDQQQQPRRAVTGAKPQNKFQQLFSDDEEEEKRIVKSAKDKRYEELQSIIKTMKSYKKNNDYTKILDRFEDLARIYEKSRALLTKDTDSVPPFYIKCIAELEDYINSSWEDKGGRSKLSKTNAKSLSALRQKLRKYNKDFETEIKEFRENPWESGEEVEEEPESQSDGDDDFGSKPSQPTAQPESDSDSEGWSSSDDEEDDDLPDMPDIKQEGDKMVFKNIAQFFLKKESTHDDKKAKPVLTEKEKEEKRLRRKREKEERKQLELEKAQREQEKVGLFPKDAEITLDLVIKKFGEVIANRGKKGTDKFEQISLLKELKAAAVDNDLGAGIITKICLSLVAAGFDLNINIFDSMKLEHWRQVLGYLDELLDLLIANMDTVSVGVDVAEDQECLKEPPFLVAGAPLTLCDRVATEFTKILQDADCHSTEYVEKLRNEPLLYNLILKCQRYLEESGATPDLLCKCYLSRIELLYYKFDKTSTAAFLESDEGKQFLANTHREPTSSELMDKLCKYIYTNDKKNWIRTRAVLCQIFNLALHDKWYQARDLMLMSHLQESIQFADVETQLLYNRTLVQLGLCAFRHGNIRAAHDALLDIQSSGRKKEQELLAQGLVTRQQEKTPEQEKIEKRRQQAFHTHINLDLLECTYLVSAMLLEIPYMASHEADTKRRMISKSFHNQLKQSERQPLPGPPENMHEHVIAASKAMRMGDWQACYNFIVNKKMNARVWSLFPNPEKVKQILKRKIQEESLRAYLFTFSSKFSTISLDNLAKQFELEKQTVHSIVSKLIITEELAASWDEPSNCIVTHPSDPSSVQKLCNHLSEKLNHLVENNERLLEAMGNKNLQFMFQSGRDQRGNQGDRKQNNRLRNQNLN